MACQSDGVPVVGNVVAQETIAGKELYLSHSARSWKKLQLFPQLFLSALLQDNREPIYIISSLISIGSLFRRETSRATQFSPEPYISAIGYLQYIWHCEFRFPVFNPAALAICKNSFIMAFPWPFYNEIFMCVYIHTLRERSSKIRPFELQDLLTMSSCVTTFQILKLSTHVCTQVLRLLAELHRREIHWKSVDSLCKIISWEPVRNSSFL